MMPILELDSAVSFAQTSYRLCVLDARCQKLVNSERLEVATKRFISSAPHERNRKLIVDVGD